MASGAKSSHGGGPPHPHRETGQAMRTAQGHGDKVRVGSQNPALSTPSTWYPGANPERGVEDQQAVRQTDQKGIPRFKAERTLARFQRNDRGLAVRWKRLAA
jgi:hypothetical protein